MEITEKEIAVLAKGLEVLLDDRAERLGVHNLRGKATWIGPPPIKDDE